MKTLDARRVLEAALLCAGQPMPLRDMQVLLGDAIEPDTVRELLAEIARDCDDKGYALVSVASGWRFQSRPEMREHLSRLSPEKPARYSRAVLETLAIIAYRQPVTRGDIEDIRGVTVASHIVKQLEDRGWIESIGHREAPGRPALLATTRQFLDDLGLASLAQLPVLSGDGSFADAVSALPAQPSLLDAPGAATEGLAPALDAVPDAAPPAAGDAHDRTPADLPKAVDPSDAAPSAAIPARPSPPTDSEPLAAPMEPHA